MQVNSKISPFTTLHEFLLAKRDDILALCAEKILHLADSKSSSDELEVYRGKTTPTQLGLRLVGRLPKILTQHFKVLVLADTAFGNNEFVTKIRQFNHHALMGVCSIRKLADGGSMRHLHKRGQQVRLRGLNFQMCLSWYYLKRSDGKLEKRAYPLHQSF